MAYFNMGNVYNRKHDYDKAIEYYKKALEIAPDCASIYRNIGVTYEDKHDYNKAIEYYKKAIELNPEEMDEIHSYIENLQSL
jgi:tetratricopeptide (TPR) repeat protein